MAKFVFTAQHYPTDPGCYLMKDTRGQVIYVGKAKNLRRRLATYFQQGRKRRYIRTMIARIRAIEVILLNNETESLVLENNLIKRHQPPFNRLLQKASTGYYYIVLTQEPVPRFVPYRKAHVNKRLGEPAEQGIAQRFGPYVSRRFRDTVLNFVNTTFQLRDCNPLPSSVCLLYHLHSCSGICEGKISAQEYQAAVARAIAFLTNQTSDLLEQMQERMVAYAEALEFERAQRVKEQLATLEQALESQIVERHVAYDQDVLYFGETHVLVMTIKRGALQGFHWLALDRTDGDQRGYEQFLSTHYRQAYPDEFILNTGSHLASVETACQANHPRVGLVIAPSTGLQNALLQLCERNYRFRFSRLAGD